MGRVTKLAATQAPGKGGGGGGLPLLRSLPLDGVTADAPVNLKTQLNLLSLLNGNTSLKMLF